MTPKQKAAAHNAAVMLGYSQGKHVQYRNIGKDEWVDISNPCWSFEVSEYRIKPEPLKMWINIYRDGSGYAHTTKSSAEQSANPSCERIAVPFIENTTQQSS